MATMQGIAVLDRVPEGWRVLHNANAAPKGYKWICNRKSRWSGEYQHALAPEDAIRSQHEQEEDLYQRPDIRHG